MSQQMRVVVAETVRRWPEEDRHVYHLRDGKGDSWFQPVMCGGGINMPSYPVKVERSKVCPDCLAGNKTL